MYINGAIHRIENILWKMSCNISWYFKNNEKLKLKKMLRKETIKRNLEQIFFNGLKQYFFFNYILLYYDYP